MISQRKIEANRRNAAKSTGPRTADGKDKVRFNAVTHGFTAATVVLPHEDEQAYQHRLEAWSGELKAPGDFGQYLVERLVKISWQLDRADTFEQAKLTKRIQDAPRLFGSSHGAPVETLFARLLGTEAETTEQKPVKSRGARRVGRAGADTDVTPPLLLRELESSSDGCRRLLAEWTRLLEWLGRLGPEGLVTLGINSRLDNLLRALGLLGVRIAHTATAAIATADPLASSFLQAWKLVEDYAMREFMEQDTDDDDDPPPVDDEPAPGVIESHWAVVGVALLKLAAERCARLRTLLAGYEQSEAEARARLACEASFDDSAEGERLHRYQARWGRSLLRTLASLEELRGRSEVVMGRGSPPDKAGNSHRCAQMHTHETEEQESFDPGKEASGCEDCVRDLNSIVVASDCDEPCSSEAGADLAGGEREAVTDQGSSAQQKENRQIEPTAERSTRVEKGSRAQGEAVNEATGEQREHRDTDGSVDESGDDRGHEIDKDHASRSLVPCLHHRPPTVSPAHTIPPA